MNLSNPTGGAGIVHGQGVGTIDDGPPGPPPPTGTPEIEVLDQFAAVVEDDLGWINAGYTHVGSPVEYAFTITNIGDGTLQLDPQSLSLPDGFSLVGSFPATVAASGSAPFVVQLDASAPGFFSGQLVFLNNDSDESPFNFTLEGEVWNLRPVALDDIYSTLQDTPLSVSSPGVLANDADPDQHAITATLVQGPAHATQFILNSDGSFSYEPQSGWTGVDSFTYAVNDGFESSEDAATVTIGVVSSFGPEIEVRYDNGISVPDGTGVVDFGETSLGEGIFISFTVMNVGPAELQLDPASLTVPSGFSVALAFDPVVAPHNFTVLTIELPASEVGTFGGALSFNNNDSDENPYDFTITGAVTAPEPEIEVLDEDFGPVVDGSGSVDLGETTVSVPIQYTFTIENTGGEDLTLDVPSLQLPTGFSLIAAFEATVAPFASTELVVQLDAAQAGVYAGEVSFENNDADEDPYNFWITGYVVSAPFLTLDLDGNDSSGMIGSDYYAEWTLGQGAVSAADPVDALVDSDSPTLESLTATITDLADAGQESLDANTAGTAIAKAYNLETGVLTLSGADTVANYQQVLRTVSYDNTAPVPTGSDRTLLFTASDGYNYATAYAYLLLLLPGENQPEVIKVEFVKKGDLDLQGVADADHYGELDPGTNPDGDFDNDGEVDGDPDDMHRGVLREPAFGGGDRFFPDATVNNPNVGKNIVRVRAYVQNMNIGDKVHFRSFDVDDPSDNKDIDRNAASGKDNRGQLRANDVHWPGDTKDNAGLAGRLRAVNAGNKLGKWGLDGKIVEAVVKQLVNAAGQPQTDAAGNPILVAEVDLLTTFAPGDNFRVKAVPDRLLAQLKATKDLPTNGNDPDATPQLAIWRYLHVEDDSSVNVYSLMQGGTVERQKNRFADAYIEPNYTAIGPAIDTSNPVGGGVLRRDNRGAVHPGDAAFINRSTQSRALERDVFWVVYVTDGLTSPAPQAIMGVTFNRFTPSSFDVSVVFTGAIAARFPADAATAGKGHGA